MCLNISQYPVISQGNMVYYRLYTERQSLGMGKLTKNITAWLLHDANAGSLSSGRRRDIPWVSTPIFRSNASSHPRSFARTPFLLASRIYGGTSSSTLAEDLSLDPATTLGSTGYFSSSCILSLRGSHLGVDRKKGSVQESRSRW